jgi:hypothetical protein
MENILTREQLDTVRYYKSRWGLDITKNWFIFSTESDDKDFLEDVGYKFFVIIQPEKNWDQDPDCDSFLPKTIEDDLEIYSDCIFGYDGDLSESEFIEILNNSPFFTYQS